MAYLSNVKNLNLWLFTLTICYYDEYYEPGTLLLDDKPWCDYADVE